MGALLLGTQFLPAAADSPFLKNGAAIDRIKLEGASLELQGSDGTRAELYAASLGFEHLSLDDSLFTIKRGLVANDAYLLTESGTWFRATTLELTADQSRHRWQGPASLERDGKTVRFEGRGELWFDARELHVVELKP